MNHVTRDDLRIVGSSWVSLIPLLAAPLLLSGCLFPSIRVDDTTRWSEFVSNELGFSVRFPTSPAEQTRTNETAIGPIEMRIFVSESSDGQSAYTVVCAQYPEAILERMTADQILDTTDDDARSKEHLEVVRFEPTSLGGVPGRALTIEDSRNGGMLNELRAYLVGSRLYSVAMTTSHRERAAERARAFLDTFTLSE